MKKFSINSKLFKVIDRLTAVFVSLCTAVFTSLAIYIFLIDYLGHDRVIAVLCQLFPSRELLSVTVFLLSLAVTGIAAMCCYSFDRLSALIAADGGLKIVGTVFLLFFTKLSVLYIVLAMCLLYFVLGVLRTVTAPRVKVDES